jgi:hypothetical protein
MPTVYTFGSRATVSTLLDDVPHPTNSLLKIATMAGPSPLPERHTPPTSKVNKNEFANFINPNFEIPLANNFPFCACPIQITNLTIRTKIVQLRLRPKLGTVPLIHTVLSRKVIKNPLGPSHVSPLLRTRNYDSVTVHMSEFPMGNIKFPSFSHYSSFSFS